jgi:hypothetical protein
MVATRAETFLTTEDTENTESSPPARRQARSNKTALCVSASLREPNPHHASSVPSALSVVHFQRHASGRDRRRFPKPVRKVSRRDAKTQRTRAAKVQHSDSLREPAWLPGITALLRNKNDYSRKTHFRPLSSSTQSSLQLKTTSS